MANIKLHDVVKPYNGEGDICEWLKKLKLVSNMLKIRELENLMPLFLEGPAFAVYEQMKECDKSDADKVERAMLDAFSLNEYNAYDQFRQRIWEAGESVDVFLTELRRLARLAGVESEELMKKSFVVGLPSDISCQLRSNAQIHNMALPEIVQQARVLMTQRSESVALVAPKRSSIVRQTYRPDVASKPLHSTSSNSNHEKLVSCFRCHGEHMSRNCPSITCFRCGIKGHIASRCLNEFGELSAPAASPDQVVRRYQ